MIWYIEKVYAYVRELRIALTLNMVDINNGMQYFMVIALCYDPKMKTLTTVICDYADLYFRFTIFSLWSIVFLYTLNRSTQTKTQILN